MIYDLSMLKKINPNRFGFTNPTKLSYGLTREAIKAQMFLLTDVGSNKMDPTYGTGFIRQMKKSNNSSVTALKGIFEKEFSTAISWLSETKPPESEFIREFEVKDLKIDRDKIFYTVKLIGSNETSDLFTFVYDTGINS